MTETVARKAARQKAATGELGFLEAFKKKALDIWVADHKKFLASAISVAGEALTLGLVHGQARTIVILALAASGTAGVHKLKNVRPKVSE